MNKISLVYVPSGVVIDMDENLFDDIFYEYDHIIDYSYDKDIYYVKDEYERTIGNFAIKLMVYKFINQKGHKQKLSKIRLLINEKSWPLVSKILKNNKLKWISGQIPSVSDYNKLKMNYKINDAIFLYLGDETEPFIIFNDCKKDKKGHYTYDLTIF